MLLRIKNLIRSKSKPRTSLASDSEVAYVIMNAWMKKYSEILFQTFLIVSLNNV